MRKANEWPEPLERLGNADKAAARPADPPNFIDAAFAEAWSEETFVRAVLAQITWHHNLAILEKIPAAEKRIWYSKAAIQHGWSRNVLVHQIETGLYRRQGKAVANFDRTLPAPQSDLARDT